MANYTYKSLICPVSEGYSVGELCVTSKTPKKGRSDDLGSIVLRYVATDSGICFIRNQIFEIDYYGLEGRGSNYRPAHLRGPMNTLLDAILMKIIHDWQKRKKNIVSSMRGFNKSYTSIFLDVIKSYRFLSLGYRNLSISGDAIENESASFATLGQKTINELELPEQVGEFLTKLDLTLDELVFVGNL